MLPNRSAAARPCLMQPSPYFLVRVSPSEYRLLIMLDWERQRKAVSTTRSNCVKSHGTETFFHTIYLTPCSKVLLEKVTGPQLVEKFPTFYGTQRFITTHTQQAATWPYSELYQSSPGPPSHLVKIHFSIILPSMPGSSKVVSLYDIHERWLFPNF